MSCMQGSLEALPLSISVLAQVRDRKVMGLQGMACLSILAGRAGTNLSRSFLTCCETVKSSLWVTSTPKNQERGPTCLALKPLGPVKCVLNHSRCLAPLWDTIMSSTYTPTTRMLSSTRLLNKHGSCVELEIT